MKTTYKALKPYRGHKTGEVFEDDLGKAFEQLAIDRGQIEKMETKGNKPATKKEG